MEHSQIVDFSQTPTLMIAGQNDDISCTAFISRASAICGGKCDFQLDDHGSGHCIPAKGFDNAVRFLPKTS